jgi:hypothetical protein
MAGRSATSWSGPTDAEGRWRRSEGGDELSGRDHGSDLQEWRPGYQHEVAVVARLRHVSCSDECGETPAVVLRIDNADHAGEVAMTADDVSVIVEGLLGLREALLAPSERSGR